MTQETKKQIANRLATVPAIYTSPNGQYVVKVDAEEECYAIINLAHGICEGTSAMLSHALYGAKSLERQVTDFYTEEKNEAPKPATVTPLRNHLPQ